MRPVAGVARSGNDQIAVLFSLRKGGPSHLGSTVPSKYDKDMKVNMQDLDYYVRLSLGRYAAAFT